MVYESSSTHISAAAVPTAGVDAGMAEVDVLWVVSQMLCLSVTVSLVSKSAFEAFRNLRDVEFKRLRPKRPMSTTRPRFLMSLAVAVWVRFLFSIVSVFCSVFYPNGTKFTRVVLYCFPSFLLLSSYSVATLFWLELHARVQFRDGSSLRPSLVLLNILFYAVFFVALIVSHIHKASYEFRVVAFILQGCAFLLTAGSWIFCGKVVLHRLSTKTSTPLRRPSSGASLQDMTGPTTAVRPAHAGPPMYYQLAGAQQPTASMTHQPPMMMFDPVNAAKDVNHTTTTVNQSWIKNSVRLRMACLTALCPIVFSAEGFYCLYLAVKMLAVRVRLQSFVCRYSTEAALLFFTEWLGPLVVVFIFKSRDPTRAMRTLVTTTHHEETLAQPLLLPSS